MLGNLGSATSNEAIAMQRLYSLLLATLFVSSGWAQERPNILFIYTDDQSHRTVGCYPDSYDWVQTPNIDQLARQGVRFDHAYIGAWCMPSRASMLTGLHQHGIESMRMEGTYPGSAYDPDQCRFWPSAFRASGYTTAHIGKWHTGIDAGFGRDWDFQMVWNRPRHPDNSPNYYDNQLISTNGGEPKLVTGYSTDNYTDWAVDYIRGEGRDQQKPWYLWLCYGAVHGPFTPADRHLDSYPDAAVPPPTDVYPPRPGKPQYVQKMEFWEPGKGANAGQPVERKVRELGPVGMKDMPGRPLAEWVRQYHQGVLAIDEGVGRLMEALVASGQDDNTLVVFTSDQGFAWGQHGFKTKVAPYRATLEAPLIIRPTKQFAANVAGRVIETPVSGVDLPPTFFAQSNIPLPWKMHGHDLSPLLESKDATWEHPAMVVHTGKLYGSATNQIPGKDDPALYHGPGIPWYVMHCKGRYKYIRNLIAGETEELYDLDFDPNELYNLAHLEKFDGIVQNMRAQAIEELRRTDAGMVDHLPPVATAAERNDPIFEYSLDRKPWIIDTHTHFKSAAQIKLESKTSNWEPKNTLGHVVLPEDYRDVANRNQIQSTMVVEAVDQSQPQFNDWLLEQAKSDLICGYVARGDLASEGFNENYQRYRGSGYLKGYRFRNDELHGYLDNATALANLAMLERDGMVVDLLVDQSHSSDVIKLATLYPKLKIVLNHCFRVKMEKGQITERWKLAVTAAAKHPNVYCKLSSILDFAGAEAFAQPAAVDSKIFQDVLGFCFDSFGEDRVVFGTNWGVCTHFGDVDDVLRIVSDFLKTKGEDVLQKGMRNNALKLYNISAKQLN
ncbi:MAG: sulfatase-like hydrolase/transferase [Pirellulaceae bacterium]